jgi:DNA-binding IclR family transcriptional regulator
LVVDGRAEALPGGCEEVCRRRDATRQNGFGRAPSTFVNGITDISAPVMRGDRAITALTVPYIKTAFAQGPITTVVKKVTATAEFISSQLTEGDNRA